MIGTQPAIHRAECRIKVYRRPRELFWMDPWIVEGPLPVDVRRRAATYHEDWERAMVFANALANMLRGDGWYSPR